MKIMFFTCDWLAPDRIFRFPYIKQFLESVSKISAEDKKLYFHCNDASTDFIQRFFDYMKPIGIKLELIPEQNLPYGPASLTWKHKKFLKDFVNSDFDYFVYCNSDLLFRQENLDYWIENHQFLKEQVTNFIPSFLRYEITQRGVPVSVDCTQQIDCKTRPVIELNGRRFVSHAQPYQGVFILDKEGAQAHLTSTYLSCDDYSNKQPHPLQWGITEAASAALLVENVPAGFEHRGVLALDDLDRCLIHHAPNKYIHEPFFATIPIDNLIIK